MSIEALSWALTQQRTKDPTSRLVLIALANHARPDGSAAFPSIATMRRYTGLDERTIRRHLRDLEAQGVISRCNPGIVAVFVQRADRRPTGYDLDLRGGTEPARESDRASVSEPNGGAHDPERGGTPPPEPSLNRTEEKYKGAHALLPAATRNARPRPNTTTEDVHGH